MGILHRMTEDELPAVLDLLAAGGGTARTRDTWTADRMTALVLGETGAPSAVMPLARRRIHVMPGANESSAVQTGGGGRGGGGGGRGGRDVETGWLSSNQFASRMGWRRQTRATAPEWASLLPEIDALLVTRREESSLAARWYATTGFEDLLSIRCLYLEMEAPPPGAAAGSRYHVQVTSPDDLAAWEPHLHAVYTDVYGTYGGPRQRSGRFWSEALRHHYYREHYQFQVIGLWESPAAGAGLVGYAVVGWSGWHSKRPRMDILELATRQWDTGIAADLIQTTCQLAWSKNVRQVRAVISAHDPYRGHLARTGFQDRWGYLMLARWLQPQRYLDRIAATLPRELGDIRLELRTPGQVPWTLARGATLASSPPGSRPMFVEGSARTMMRLLFNRLDVAAAVQEGALAGPAGSALGESDTARLSAAFPWTPWAFHMLDFI
jgi:hypothetical protein